MRGIILGFLLTGFVTCLSNAQDDYLVRGIPPLSAERCMVQPPYSEDYYCNVPDIKAGNFLLKEPYTGSSYPWNENTSVKNKGIQSKKRSRKKSG